MKRIKEVAALENNDKENYVTVSKIRYNEMLNKIDSLQKRLLATNQILSGEVNEYRPHQNERLKRFKK